MRRVIFQPLIALFIFAIFYTSSTYYFSNIIIDSYKKTLDSNLEILHHEHTKEFFKINIASKINYKDSVFEINSTFPNSVFSFLTKFDVNSTVEILDGELKKFFRDSKFADATLKIEDGVLKNTEIKIASVEQKSKNGTFKLDDFKMELSFKDRLVSKYSVSVGKAMIFTYSSNLGLSLEDLELEISLLKPESIGRFSELSDIKVKARELNLSAKLDKTYSLSAKNLKFQSLISDDRCGIKILSAMNGMSLKPKNKFINPLNLSYEIEIVSKNSSFHKELLKIDDKFKLLNLSTNKISKITVANLFFEDKEGRDLSLNADLSLKNSPNLQYALHFIDAKGKIKFEKSYLSLFIYDALIREALINSGLLVDKGEYFKVNFLYDSDTRDIFINENISLGSLIYGEKFDGFNKFIEFQ
ncbi:MAG: hypothetical protein GX282_08540 [Campylobacteraceae bacterium]|nr:hypothetical protein [Campylobacteraceae bacterium]